MIQIFFVVFFAVVVAVLGLIGSSFFLGLASRLAQSCLVEKLFNLINDPIKVIDDGIWSHLISQISDAFEHFLDDFFAKLYLHNLLEMGHEQGVNELFDLSR